MINYLVLLVAIILSGVAAYYSIIGLIAIFAAAVIPIAVMGSTLEIAKLVAASWVYRNWSNAPKVIKYYLITAIFVLMFITSMGIFGFLSKAHMDQVAPSGDALAKIELIDQRISIEEDILKSAKQELDLLNEQTKKYNELGAVSRGVAVREQTREDRERLFSEIETAQNKIIKYREEKAPISAAIRQLEAEVGPIKYIADLIYDNSSTDMLERAVRAVIILIVLVFDPLAIVLLIAANHGLATKQEVVVSKPRGRPKKIDVEPEWVSKTKEYKMKRDPNKIEIDKKKIKSFEDGGSF